tara:strand:+ start:17273 stop:17632 length:360 start_codon:yes stop_codon:yes gene_type:complete
MTQDSYYDDRFDEDGRLKPILADIGTGGSFVNDMSIIFRLYKQGDISLRRFKSLSRLHLFKHKVKLGHGAEFVAEFNRFSFMYSDDMKEVYFIIAEDSDFARFFPEEEWKSIQASASRF